MARDIGRRVAARLGQLAHVVFALAQQIQDLQARGLGQHLEIGGNLLQSLGGKVFFHNSSYLQIKSTRAGTGYHGPRGGKANKA